MNKKYRFFILIILMMLFASPRLFAQEVQKLKLEDFLKKCASNSRFALLVSERLQQEYSFLSQEEAVEISLGARGNLNLPFADPASFTLSPSVSLDAFFPNSDSALSLGYSGPGSASSPKSSISLEWQQSLLNNSFGKETRMLARENELAREVALYQASEAYEEYFYTLINLYLDWHEAAETVRASEKSLADSQALLNQNLQKQSYGIARPAEVDKSRLQVLRKEEQLLQNQKDYQDISENLFAAALISENSFQPADIPLTLLKFDDDNIKLKELVEQSRSYKTAALLVEKSRLALGRSRDALLPSIGLSAGFKLSGDGYLVYENISPALTLGLDFDFPFLRKAEKDREKLRREQLKYSQLELKDTGEQMHLQLDLLKRSLLHNQKLLEMAEQKITISERILRAEQQEFNRGNTDLGSLIGEYNNLESARQDRLALQLQKARLLLQWKSKTDQLLTESKKFSLPEKGE